ncbi:hypothetical protein SLOPH_480 [Spraguea lophii 42_110]|uniref:Derlin n=1 Tax=Spraguea lophii (strain 42_110) TaxID=1358809 RepID=S7XQS6_SPRLO|nr:hypothetical protein SLOPH_480 [Spraguea lophii 42_110]
MVSATIKITFISILIPAIIHIFPETYKHIYFNIYNYKHILQCYRLFLSLFINSFDIKLLFDLLFRFNILKMLEECTGSLDVQYFTILSLIMVFISSLENVFYSSYFNSSLVIYLSFVTDQQFLIYGFRVDPKYIPILSIALDILNRRYKVYYPIGFSLFYNFIVKSSKDYIPEILKKMSNFIDARIENIKHYKFDRTIKRGRVLGKRQKVL